MGFYNKSFSISSQTVSKLQSHFSYYFPILLQFQKPLFISIWWLWLHYCICICFLSFVFASVCILSICSKNQRYFLFCLVCLKHNSEVWAMSLKTNKREECYSCFLLKSHSKHWKVPKAKRRNQLLLLCQNSTYFKSNLPQKSVFLVAVKYKI